MTKIPQSHITPDSLDSPIGELKFVDGAPSTVHRRPGMITSAVRHHNTRS